MVAKPEPATVNFGRELVCVSVWRSVLTSMKQAVRTRISLVLSVWTSLKPTAERWSSLLSIKVPVERRNHFHFYYRCRLTKPNSPTQVGSSYLTYHWLPCSIFGVNARCTLCDAGGLVCCALRVVTLKRPHGFSSWKGRGMNLLIVLGYSTKLSVLQTYELSFSAHHRLHRIFNQRS